MGRMPPATAWRQTPAKESNSDAGPGDQRCQKPGQELCHRCRPCRQHAPAAGAPPREKRSQESNSDAGACQKQKPCQKPGQTPHGAGGGSQESNSDAGACQKQKHGQKPCQKPGQTPHGAGGGSQESNSESTSDTGACQK
jgi:hypothetical protein